MDHLPGFSLCFLRYTWGMEHEYPVLEGVWDRKHLRVWCDQCFLWHWHGGPGLKVPHCAFSPSFYDVVESDADPDRVYAHRRGTQWRAVCPRSGCNTHLRPTIGRVSRPHDMVIVPRPGPGSPVQCIVTGEFYDLRTGEWVDPDYTETDRIRYRYLDDYSLRPRGIAHRQVDLILNPQRAVAVPHGAER